MSTDPCNRTTANGLHSLERSGWGQFIVCRFCGIPCTGDNPCGLSSHEARCSDRSSDTGIVTRPCWNCEGTGRGLVWNEGADAPTRQFVPGPCVVCSGRGRLAAND